MSKPERMLVFPIHGDDAIVDCPACGAARGYLVSHGRPACAEDHARFAPDAPTLEAAMEREIMRLLEKGAEAMSEGHWQLGASYEH